MKDNALDPVFAICVGISGPLLFVFWRKNPDESSGCRFTASVFFIGTFVVERIVDFLACAEKNSRVCYFLLFGFVI